jgi:hypothetical protein
VDVAQHGWLSNNFGRFIIHEFGEVESGNLGIYLWSYTFMRVMRYLMELYLVQELFSKEEASEECLVLMFYLWCFCV